MNKLIQKSTSRAFMYPLVCFLFLIKRNVIAKSMDNLLPMQEKEKKNKNVCFSRCSDVIRKWASYRGELE